MEHLSHAIDMIYIRSFSDSLYACCDQVNISISALVSIIGRLQGLSPRCCTRIFCRLAGILQQECKHSLKDSMNLRKLEFLQNSRMEHTKLSNPYLLTIQPQIHCSSPLTKVRRFINLLNPIAIQLRIL